TASALAHSLSRVKCVGEGLGFTLSRFKSKKQAKSEESTRPKSKFLELKPFEYSMDHSASLVKIVDQLGDSPFGRFHCRLALSFSIVVFWIIGTLEQKARIRPFGDSPNGFSDSQIFISLIKCALKVSSCDIALSKNLELTILDSNASSSSTIFSKFCAAVDHSTSLVEIVDQLSYCPLVGFVAVLLYFSASSCFGSLGDIVLLRETARRHIDCSFSLPI
ncbi:hypothetical protein H5410_041253, partial [Solanum commersonii]